MEIWKDIPEYEGLYQVSNLGNVKTVERKSIYSNGRIHYYKERIKKQFTGNKNYKIVTLYKNKIPKSFSVHRLVAIAFIPNPKRLPCVNHIDENRQNNDVSNLEWVTYEENTNHGTCIQRRAKKFSKKVYQYDINKNLINTYPSCAECERKTGFNSSKISACCNGKRKTHKGYIWSYTELKREQK